MSTPPPKSKATGAIIIAAVIEAVMLGIGMLLYFKFDSIWPLAVAAGLGAAVFFFFAWQGGLFERRDDRG